MTPVIERLRTRVAALCSEECAGREAGSREGARARELILAELAAAGVTPTLQAVVGCRGTNLIVRLGPPSDQAVLIGAHYDHLGRAAAGTAYWGADDNAAAVAVLLELITTLQSETLPREVIVVFFDGEEPPHFLTSEMGSMQYVEEPAAPLAQTRVAIILDLVGHAIGPEAAPPNVRDTLFALGAEKTAGHAAVVAAAGRDLAGVNLRQLDLDLVPPLSDYEGFRRRGVPVVFLTCARWRHYHEITDTPDRLDYAKLEATTELVHRLVRGFATTSVAPARYDPTGCDHATSIAALLELGRELAPIAPAAGLAVGALEELAGRAVPALSDQDWARLRQIIAMMEQGLA